MVRRAGATGVIVMTTYKYPTPMPASSDPVILGRHSLIWPATGRSLRITVTAMHRRHRNGAIYARPSDWIAQAGKTIAQGYTRREAVAALIDLARRRGADAILDGEAMTPLSVEAVARWWDSAASETEQIKLMHLMGLAPAWVDETGLVPSQDIAHQ